MKCILNVIFGIMLNTGRSAHQNILFYFNFIIGVIILIPKSSEFCAVCNRTFDLFIVVRSPHTHTGGLFWFYFNRLDKISFYPFRMYYGCSGNARMRIVSNISRYTTQVCMPGDYVCGSIIYIRCMGRTTTYSVKDRQ